MNRPQRSDINRWKTARRLLAVAIPYLLLSTAQAADHVSLERDGARHHLDGKVVVEGQDGSLLFMANDSVLWLISKEEQLSRSSDDESFKWLDDEQLEKRLLKQLPVGFKIHRTAHYLIVYNTSPAYAAWCGSLYERLYRAFFGFWKKNGIELEEPDHRLVAIVFRDKGSYAQYARRDLGDATSGIIGYYNILSNRVVMYDLTGVNALARPGRRITSARQINQILMQPAAERTVATIVHEATHQLSYNSGLQIRLGGNPFWLSEGLAMFFESPDLKSSRGWRGIGNVNSVQLLQFRKHLRERAPDRISELLRRDAEFRQADAAQRAYADAWALTYFLLKTRKQQFVQYIKTLAETPPLGEPSEEEREAQFRDIFGVELEEMDTELIRYMRRLR